MRTPRPLPEGAAERWAALLQEAKSKADYQRIPCVWLRAALGLHAPQIAIALGWKVSSPRTSLHDTTWTAGSEREPEHYRELLLALPPLGPDDHLVDVGAGTGKLAAVIARGYPELGRVTLIEPNAPKVARAVVDVLKVGIGAHCSRHFIRDSTKLEWIGAEDAELYRIPDRRSEFQP